VTCIPLLTPVCCVYGYSFWHQLVTCPGIRDK
jgi:hypothetical protein